MAREHWNPESHWDNHPDHTVGDWIDEVADKYTRQSYIDWVNSQIESHKNDLLPCPMCQSETAPKVWLDDDGGDVNQNWTVVCSVGEESGGCGCSSGYAQDINQAIVNWNTRVEKE